MKSFFQGSSDMMIFLTVTRGEIVVNVGFVRNGTNARYNTTTPISSMIPNFRRFLKFHKHLMAAHLSPNLKGLMMVQRRLKLKA